MKKITLLAAFCLSLHPVLAQIDLGIKGGLNLTNISGDLVTADYQIQSTPKSQVGYHAGGFLRASLFGIFIQPELVFTSVASEFTVTDQVTAAEEFARQRIGRIDVPVIVGARLGTLRLGLGPVGSIIVAEKSDLADLTGYETDLRAATVGYQVGVGLDIWKAGLDVRYEGNLSKLGDQMIVAGQPVSFDSRARQVIFSLSFRF